MIQKELELILKENYVWLGIKCEGRRTDEARITHYLEGNYYAAAVVEDGFADHGYNCMTADAHEEIYLIHKPTRRAEGFGNRILVRTTAISRPRYKLENLAEANGVMTLTYSQGDKKFEKKFCVETESHTVTETKFKEVEEKNEN